MLNYLSCNCRFLRQRYRYLMQNPSTKQDTSHQQKLKVHATLIRKGKKHNRKESTLHPATTSHLKSKGRISNRVGSTVQKTVPMFDLNKNASSLSKKEPSFLNSAPVADLNHEDRIHSGKEASKKNISKFFDLNQIWVNNYTCYVISSLCLYFNPLGLYFPSILVLS